jgi:cytochrome c oxidase cbb3-type subunit 3
VTCHGALAQGTETAPNLTDEFWLHGGGVRNVFRTITHGVPGKAMISWSQKLSPRQVNEVASFVLSLQGSHPAGAKLPEGTLYREEAGTVQPDSSKTN